MLITESRLRAWVRAILQEGEGYDVELGDIEVQGDDLELTEEQLEAMERAYQQSQNVQVRSKNLKKGSQHLLGLKVQEPERFETLVRGWAHLSRNQKAGMVQWLKALESGEVQSQLGYGKVNNYRDLSAQFLKNRNWLGFVGWYLQLLQGSRARSRQLTTDPFKISKKKG